MKRKTAAKPPRPTKPKAGDRLEPTTRRAVLRGLHGILAKDDSTNLTAELLDERREEAEAKRW